MQGESQVLFANVTKQWLKEDGRENCDLDAQWQGLAPLLQMQSW